MTVCNEHKHLIAYALLEFLLGRRARAGGPGSVVEVLLVCGYSCFKRLVNLLRRKKDEPRDQSDH